jgi:HD-GYP domain-containing protein (c-di-GMP phosphodiesterase class II)
MSSDFDALYNHNLLLKLTPVSLRSLITLRVLPCDLYSKENYQFKVIANLGDPFTKDHAKNLFLKGFKYFFIHENEYPKFVEANKVELLKTARALSMGDPKRNVHYKVELLNQGLKLLYTDPTDDELLQQQHRSINNLAQFLLNEKGVIKSLYTKQTISPDRYLYQQPLHASVLLLGLLKYLRTFNNQDVLNLFITSYLKDIGMSLIPKELEGKENLTQRDKLLMGQHAAHSSDILSGRVNLDNHYLNIIENHHLTTDLDSDNEITAGIESVLINVVDIFVAMTSKRPYRDALSPYDALERIKQVMLPKYALEFKYLVHYLKKMLS